MDGKEKIKQWKEMGLTNREISRKLNCSESQISRWLNGSHEISAAWEYVIRSKK